MISKKKKNKKTKTKQNWQTKKERNRQTDRQTNPLPPKKFKKYFCLIAFSTFYTTA